MSIFEAIMLICFGAGWPISVAKALRTKVVSGKSPLFMANGLIVCPEHVIHSTVAEFIGEFTFHADCTLMTL